MPSTFSISPLLGVDVTATYPTSGQALGSGIYQPPHRSGTVVSANDGKRYVFAQAAGAIPASTAACTVSPTTFQATSGGGNYTSPATAMASGDFGWFATALV